MSIRSIYDGAALRRGIAFAIIFDRFLRDKDIEFKQEEGEGSDVKYARAYFDSVLYNEISDGINVPIVDDSFSAFFIDRGIGRTEIHGWFQIPKKAEERKYLHDQYKGIALPLGIKTRRDLIRWMQERSPGAIVLMREVVSSFSAYKCFQDAKSKVEAKLSLSVQEMAYAYKKMAPTAVPLTNVIQPREKGCAFHIVIILLGILLMCLLKGK